MPALIAAAGDAAGWRYVEFFAANIENPHTRRAYARACGRFFGWCERPPLPRDLVAEDSAVVVCSGLQSRERLFDRPVPLSSVAVIPRMPPIVLKPGDALTE